MTRNSLWKLFSIAAVLTLLLVACGGDDDDTAPTSTSPSEGGAPTATRETGGDEGGGNGGGDSELIAMGEDLYNSQGCAGCHSTDGSAGVGPTWQGLYGEEVTLNDGSTVTADDAYIHESIVDPNAKVVDGFTEGLMPSFDTLTDDQIAAITAFIKSLSE